MRARGDVICGFGEEEDLGSTRSAASVGVGGVVGWKRGRHEAISVLQAAFALQLSHLQQDGITVRDIEREEKSKTSVLISTPPLIRMDGTNVLWHHR